MSKFRKGDRELREFVFYALSFPQTRVQVLGGFLLTKRNIFTRYCSADSSSACQEKDYPTPEVDHGPGLGVFLARQCRSLSLSFWAKFSQDKDYPAPEVDHVV